MLVKNLQEYIISCQNTQIPIINAFKAYFSQFNTKKVLVLTDEDVTSDLRVQHQIFALQLLSDDVTVLRVQPKNDYSEKQKKQIRRKTLIDTFKHIWLLPRFYFLTKAMSLTLPMRQKAKQGIYNDNTPLISEKIYTNEYTLVVCNNLISALMIDVYPNIDYIYDVHELEVFRSRKHQSLERSFYIYLQERKIIKKIKNLITIGKKNAELIGRIHHINTDKIHCVYNQNFPKHELVLRDDTQKKADILLIYIGRVNKDRGLDDIIGLTNTLKVLVIACNYSKDAMDYLLANANSENLILFKGMDYQQFLSEQLQCCMQAYFLTLISPISLSYRNALPNKFFQAQILGLPIVAYPNTYLANIISGYACGIIFDENFWKAIRQVAPADYQAMCHAMRQEVATAIVERQL